MNLATKRESIVVVRWKAVGASGNTVYIHAMGGSIDEGDMR
jgi:hypothetical protein